MRRGTSPIVKVEDIMTPRSAFIAVEPAAIDKAPVLARENDFEIIPIVDKGHIRTFWRRKTRRVYLLGERHRVQYYMDVASILRRLAKREAQFVCYQDEVVGIVDLSDLNKPIARLVWLHPILDLEQGILSEASKREITEEAVRQTLGSSVKGAVGRQRKAEKQDLSLPLIAFLQFPEVLRFARECKIIPIEEDEIRSLNEVRRRSAHGVLRPIEHVRDGIQLVRALQICKRLLDCIHNA